MSARRVFHAIVVVMALAATIAATSVIARAADDVLSAGTYTASVKALVCRGCGPTVKRTLEALKPIESVSVDQQAASVQFVVKKDATIRVSELQDALKTAADKMGMGADYTLSNIKARSK